MKISMHSDDADGMVRNMPAFRCHLTPAGTWSFKCSCGQVHTHGSGEGHRKAICTTHRATGYWLLPPTAADHEEELAFVQTMLNNLRRPTK